MASNINPITGNPNTNAEKAALSKWQANVPVNAQKAEGNFKGANWSNAGVKKAAGEAKPLEEAPKKLASNINRNTTGGTALSFRKTRKRKTRKTRKSRSRK